MCMYYMFNTPLCCFQMYIYDLRHSNPCERISRHSDVVFDVAFHPNTSQVNYKSNKENSFDGMRPVLSFECLEILSSKLDSFSL
jgi:hypothetical protein